MSPRISTEFAAAQIAKVRETGLKVSVVEQSVNTWEYLVGATIEGSANQPFDGTFGTTDIEYWGYRSGSSMCILDNGTIVRVRNGDDPPTAADRQIYVQEVTDPTILSQWTTWSVLYSGDHYGRPEVLADGNNYVVYHAKDDGLYRNNVLVWLSPDLPAERVIGFHVIQNQLDAGWPIVLKRDPVPGDLRRIMQVYYSPDIVNVTPVLDPIDYQWWVISLAGWLLDDGRIARFHCSPLYFDSRTSDRGDSIWMQFQTAVDDLTLTPPRAIRGIGGGAGQNRYLSPTIHQLSDGYYYIHVLEQYRQYIDGVLGDATNLGRGLRTWMRSKDLVNWSEATVGPAAQSGGFATIVEHPNGNVYWADNGQVWKRATAVTETAIENYIPEISFDLPKEHQEGSGEASVANPAGVNDWLLPMSDRQLKVEAGLKVATGSYEFVPFGPFFLKYCNRHLDGKINRITMHFGDLWMRLAQPLKDTYNFVGKLQWSDWSIGKRNQAFNYYFSQALETFAQSLIMTEDCMYTGWRGQNADFSVNLDEFYTGGGSGPVIGIGSRYLNTENYIIMRYREDDATVAFSEVVDSVENNIDTVGVTISRPVDMRLVLRFNHYECYFNGDLIMSGTHEFILNKPGYSGVLSRHNDHVRIRNWELTDWEYDFQVGDLIKSALALGDFHDVVVNNAATKAYALHWGPSTDLSTAAEALRQLLVSLKLQIALRGTELVVDKFTDRTITHDLENLIISTAEEAENRQRINVAVVDGNQYFWIYVDTDSITEMRQQVVDKFDLPELLELTTVQERAQEEVLNTNRGEAPSGMILLLFDLWRMDFVTWTDNAGVEKTVRVEGMSVNIKQDNQPSQRMSLDTSIVPDDQVVLLMGVAPQSLVGAASFAYDQVIPMDGIVDPDGIGQPEVIS